MSESTGYVVKFIKNDDGILQTYSCKGVMIKLGALALTGVTSKEVTGQVRTPHEGVGLYFSRPLLAWTPELPEDEAAAFIEEIRQDPGRFSCVHFLFGGPGQRRRQVVFARNVETNAGLCLDMTDVFWAKNGSPIKYPVVRRLIISWDCLVKGRPATTQELKDVMRRMEMLP